MYYIIQTVRSNLSIVQILLSQHRHGRVCKSERPAGGFLLEILTLFKKLSSFHHVAWWNDESFL